MPKKLNPSRCKNQLTLLDKIINIYLDTEKKPITKQNTEFRRVTGNLTTFHNTVFFQLGTDTKYYLLCPFKITRKVIDFYI
jgi:hypothetical protein